MRWVDSDSSRQRRQDRLGLGWLFWWGAGSDREPQPRIVPKWMTGQAPKHAGQIDFVFIQIKLAWPHGHSRRMCSSDSVTLLQTEHWVHCL